MRRMNRGTRCDVADHGTNQITDDDSPIQGIVIELKKSSVKCCGMQEKSMSCLFNSNLARTCGSARCFSNNSGSAASFMALFGPHFGKIGC